MTVGGLVEVDEEVGPSRRGNGRQSREVFTLNAEARTAGEAADLIREYSEEVCAQRAWVGYGGGPS